MTFETFDQSDEKTLPDQKRSTYLPTYLPTCNTSSIVRYSAFKVLAIYKFKERTDSELTFDLLSWMLSFTGATFGGGKQGKMAIPSPLDSIATTLSICTETSRFVYSPSFILSGEKHTG